MMRAHAVRSRHAKRSQSPSASAIREMTSEERCDDPAESGPKQRIYEECGQWPKVPPPLLPGATNGAVMLGRRVLWCAPMRHFIRRRPDRPKEKCRALHTSYHSEVRSHLA